jgi:hypothetical protein
LLSWYVGPANALLGGTRHATVPSVPVFIAALALAATVRRRIAACLVCLVIYMLPIAVFMHLYLIHVYYSYENALFLLIVVGCGIVTGLEGKLLVRWLSVGVFAAALLAMTTNFLAGYYADQQSDSAAQIPVTAALQQHTNPNDVLLIYGLDLVPEVPYRTRRRAIMDWENRGAGDPALQQVLAAVGREGNRVGAMLVCGTTRQLAIIPINIERLGLRDNPSFQDGYCEFYLPR